MERLGFHFSMWETGVIIVVESKVYEAIGHDFRRASRRYDLRQGGRLGEGRPGTYHIVVDGPLIW